MSEEHNDSPAFRLRPRRAAPKSYYTVRLEYSANPAAFVRERPRNCLKRRVFSQKSGSQAGAASAGKYKNQSSNYRLPVPSKEERELEERRARLHRNISESITTDTPISPFIERLEVGELCPESIYEHNYITARIKRVRRPAAAQRLLVCLCQSLDCPSEWVEVHLHDEYANENLVRPDKLISIAKFKTGAARSGEQPQIKCERSAVGAKLEAEPEQLKNGATDERHAQAAPTGAALSFDVIVKYEELTERPACGSTGRSGGGGGGGTPSASSSFNGSKKRPLIPFVSITDMIEHPTEPFVEMSV